jgi:hypothetical protein
MKRSVSQFKIISVMIHLLLEIILQCAVMSTIQVERSTVSAIFIQ